MPSSTDNVKIGVCTVNFAGTDLGYTKGGCEVEVTTETYAVTVDQFGETPINEYIIGRKASAKTPLAETTLENLVATMPGAALVVDSVDALKRKANVTNAVGVNLLSIAGILILHPIGAGTSVLEDVRFPKAATPGNMNFAYRLQDERIYDVMWMAYPDTANGNILFVIGDQTATP